METSVAPLAPPGTELSFVKKTVKVIKLAAERHDPKSVEFRTEIRTRICRFANTDADAIARFADDVLEMGLMVEGDPDRITVASGFLTVSSGIGWRMADMVTNAMVEAIYGYDVRYANYLAEDAAARAAVQHRES